MFNCTLSKKFDSSFYLLNNGDEDQIKAISTPYWEAFCDDTKSI